MTKVTFLIRITTIQDDLLPTIPTVSHVRGDCRHLRPPILDADADGEKVKPEAYLPEPVVMQCVRAQEAHLRPVPGLWRAVDKAKLHWLSPPHPWLLSATYL